MSRIDSFSEPTMETLTLFVVVGLWHVTPATSHPFAPNGFRCIPQAAAIVFFSYICFDSLSTAAS